MKRIYNQAEEKVAPSFIFEDNIELPIGRWNIEECQRQLNLSYSAYLDMVQCREYSVYDSNYRRSTSSN